MRQAIVARTIHKASETKKTSIIYSITAGSLLDGQNKVKAIKMRRNVEEIDGILHGRLRIRILSSRAFSHE